MDDTWPSVVAPPGIVGPVTVTVALSDGEALSLDRFAYVERVGAGFSDATFTNLPTHVGPSTGAAAVDLDGDGDLDLAVSDEDVGLRLLLNDGEGRFAEGDSPSDALTGGQDVLAADMEGDGDADLVLTRGDLGSAVLYNDGNAGFVVVELGEAAASAALGDVNGDGAIDLLLAVAGQDRFALGDGVGGFGTFQDLPPEEADTREILLGTLDDGDTLDAVAIDFLGLDRLLLGRGDGAFDVQSDPFGDDASLQSYAGSLGDIDGDDDLDLLVAQGGATGQNQLFLGDGRGAFIEATDQMPQVAYGSADIALVDVDADGDLDGLVANFWGPVEAYENTAGSFAAAAWFPETDGLLVAIATGDFNADGSLDVFFAGYGAQDRLFLAR